MLKILKEETAKLIGEEVIMMIREKHQELNDQQIRAALNHAARMTTPFVKKVQPVQEAREPVQEYVEPVQEAREPVQETREPVTDSYQ